MCVSTLVKNTEADNKFDDGTVLAEAASYEQNLSTLLRLIGELEHILNEVLNTPADM